MTEEQKQRFEAWWNCEKTDRPLVRICARKEQVDERSLLPTEPYLKSAFDFHLNPRYRINAMRNHMLTHDYLAEYFPYVDLNLGPGSMASYLICEPGFSNDTIWYNEAEVESISELRDISFEKSTHWWDDHLRIIREAVEMAGEDMYIAIPDIQENLDIVSAMRGPQNLCLDILDDPDGVKDVQAIVDRDFYKYYDAMYELVKDGNGDSVFTAFAIWGRGKTAKLQCDFSTLVSKDVFDEFVVPSLRRQCEALDTTMYHLDGKGAVRHLDSIMGMEKLKALQWTPGAGQEDGGGEEWFPIYDTVREAGKALWIRMEDGVPDEWLFKAQRILKRYGPRGIYFWFPDTDRASAERVLEGLYGY